MTYSLDSPAELLRPIAQVAEHLAQTIEDDYSLDGILFCGKCHTPKEILIPVGEQTMLVKCLCTCATERRDKLEEHQRIQAIQDMKADWIHYTGETAIEKIFPSKAQRVAENTLAKLDVIIEKGLSMVLRGGTGCGKTMAAGIIANAALSKGYRVYMATVGDMISQLYAEETRTKLENRLRTFDLVVIDDLGSERQTQYGISSAFNIVDMRVQTGKFTIITTNLRVETREDIDYQRIMSRISSFVVVNCGNEDYREGQGKEKRAQFKELIT